LKALFDINHPAHVHFFREPIARLKKKGWEIVITSRDKDVTLQLLKEYGLESTVLTKIGRGALSLAGELLVRDYKLFRLVRDLKPDVMASIGGTFIAHVSAISKVPSLVFYDTENARAQNFITYPFATEIHVPACYEAKLPADKSFRYQGYHELSYLHPDIFSPDRGLAVAAGLDPNKKNYLIRLVSWQANHDVGVSGWNSDLLKKVVDKLAAEGNVLISTEAELPEYFSPWIYTGKPSDLHHVLACSSLCIGESATLASESAVLGVPAIYMATEGRGYTNEQQNKYQLVKNILAIDERLLFSAIDEMLSPDASFYQQQKELLLADKIDVAKYVVDRISMFLPSKLVD
jgi:predicted glycosyltransferase